MASVLIGGSFVFLAVDRSTGGNIVAVAANVLRDPLAVFDGRSPGQRAAGALTQTKARLASNGRKGPHERVLSMVRDRPGGAADGLPPGDFASPFGTSVVPDGLTGSAGPDMLSMPELASAPPVHGPIFFPMGAPPLSPLGFTGKQSADDPTATDVGDIAPAVPEPATWAMMLVGFFSVGMAMRRRKPMASPIPAGLSHDGKD